MRTNQSPAFPDIYGRLLGIARKSVAASFGLKADTVCNCRLQIQNEFVYLVQKLSNFLGDSSRKRKRVRSVIICHSTKLNSK